MRHAERWPGRSRPLNHGLVSGSNPAAFELSLPQWVRVRVRVRVRVGVGVKVRVWVELRCRVTNL
jgi:hypothetical protein